MTEDKLLDIIITLLVAILGGGGLWVWLSNRKKNHEEAEDVATKSAVNAMLQSLEWLKKRVGELDDENATFRREIAELRAEVEALKKEKTSLVCENLDLRKRVDELQAENIEQRKEMDTLKQENAELRKEVGRLRDEVESKS